MFGGFVALALWLPRYLIGVYGLDITTAGMIGAFYSVPASLFRIYGGVLSDKVRRASRHVLDLRRLGRCVALSSPIRRPSTLCRVFAAR